VIKNYKNKIAFHSHADHLRIGYTNTNVTLTLIR